MDMQSNKTTDGSSLVCHGFQPNYQGIQLMQNIVHLLFVDDMDICSAYDADSLQAIINTLKEFEENTGLKVNYCKSVVYRIGSIESSAQKLKTSEKFKWSNESISGLSVVIRCTEGDLKSNYTAILKVENLLKNGNKEI